MGPVRLGYLARQSDLASNIFIPRYYDPSIGRRLGDLAITHEPVVIGDLIDRGHIDVLYGHDIGKMHYGGHISYVRTSDLSSWELVGQPKQAVGEEAYRRFAAKQDVAAGDVFFVRDGLYLIGAHALVTEADLPLIHQSHLIRFRARRSSPVQAPLLLALLSTPIVRRQVRSKQFTAGIIDKIEDRYREIVLPLPRDARLVHDLNAECGRLVERRVELRERLRRVPSWIEGLIPEPDTPVPRHAQDFDGESARKGFVRSIGAVRGNIFIPKFYDPSIPSDLARLRREFQLRTVGDLVSDGSIEAQTGVEVGKLAYGMGPVPFIRTSDLSDWELKGEPKQRVSENLFDRLRGKVDVQSEDILLVRDGTYLVGTSAMVTASDRGMLYAGGLYKLRATRPDDLDPYLLLALLNMPIVKRQIAAMRFTRDIIDTLGRRLFDLVLPIPRDGRRRDEVASVVRDAVEERGRLREREKEIALLIEGPAGMDAEEREFVEQEPE